jgi:hypothetical protein
MSPTMMRILRSLTFRPPPLTTFAPWLPKVNRSQKGMIRRTVPKINLGRMSVVFAGNGIIHIYKNCKVLKDLKASNSPSPAASSIGKANMANNSSSMTPSSDHQSGVALSALSAPSPGTALHTNIESQQVWILDTGTSHHITSDLSHLHSPVPLRLGIKVGGGQVLYSAHKGNVILKFFVDGRVIPVALYDVLYIPEWNMGENLVSWSTIDAKRTAYQHSTNGMSDIRMKNNNQTFLRALLKDGIYHLDISTIYGKVYVSTVQFWHEALDHSSPSQWTNARAIYQDGTLLPKRPS